MASVGSPPGIGRRLHHAVGAGSAGIFGAPGDDHPELGRDHVEPLGDVLANAVQTAATATDEAFGFDDLLDPRQMPGNRTTIGAAPPGRSARGAILGFFLGVDGRDGRFQILQRQLELVWIALFRSAPEGRLLERGNQLFQLGDPLVLALTACLRSDKHRLERGNVVGEFGGIEHDRKLPDQAPPLPQKDPP